MDVQQEHVLICLSPSIYNRDVIKMAAAVARDNKAVFTALFVETPDNSKISKEDREQLQANIDLARQLGANIETAFGEDIVYQINEFCHNSQVTKVFIGYSQRKKWRISYNALDKQILETLCDLDVNVVYHQSGESKKSNKKKKEFIYKTSDFLISILVLLLATAIGMLFHWLGFSEANTITIYILGVLIIAVSTSNRIFSLVSSILSVLIFNFMFTNPRFTFAAYGSGYPVTFAIMLIAAFITSTLAIRIKKQAKQSAQYAYRTKVLLETNRLLQKEKSIAGIKQTTAKQIIKLLEMPVIICQVNQDNQIEYENYGNDNIDVYNFGIALVDFIKPDPMNIKNFNNIHRMNHLNEENNLIGLSRDNPYIYIGIRSSFLDVNTFTNYPKNDILGFFNPNIDFYSQNYEEELMLFRKQKKAFGKLAAREMSLDIIEKTLDSAFEEIKTLAEKEENKTALLIEDNGFEPIQDLKKYREAISVHIKELFGFFNE